MMIEKKKTYIGTFKTEEEAARTYDRYSILINGINAKTNFEYTKAEIVDLLSQASFM